MPKMLIASLALVGLMALAAAFANNSGRADPALSRAASVLPPPRTPVRKSRLCPLYPLGMFRLAALSRRG